MNLFKNFTLKIYFLTNTCAVMRHFSFILGFDNFMLIKRFRAMLSKALSNLITCLSNFR